MAGVSCPDRRQMSTAPENEFDLEKLFLPSWAQEPASSKQYAQYEGGEERYERREGRGRPPQRRQGAPGRGREQGARRDAPKRVSPLRKGAPPRPEPGTVEPLRTAVRAMREHAELAWVLNCFTTFGELRRMTQFKEKAQAQAEGSVLVGLFDYPVLQAADILLYQADRVPVGEDQRQHVELTRDIAQRFNHRFGETFVVPEVAIPKVGARIMDLQNPAAKMSKSAESPQGTIGVLDSPEDVSRKVKAAVTDSGRDVVSSPDKPAITNLLTIYSVVTGRNVSDIEGSYEGRGYADLKSDLAEAIILFLSPLQEQFRDISSDPGRLRDSLELGAQKAQKVAGETLHAVYERVGFVPRRR